MTAKHAHILMPGPDRPAGDVALSSLASERLRILPALKAINAARWKVSLGDRAASSANVVLIGKPGAQNIEDRSRAWLDQLQLWQRQGARLFLDYTDHHLGKTSPMTAFYENAIAVCSEVVVPTEALKTTVGNLVSGKTISVVEDLLEYPTVKPIDKGTATSKRCLWFGHPSNADFLARFIDDNSAAMADHELVIISLPHTVDILKRYRYQNSPSVKLGFQAWSKNTLLEASRQADYCIIPSDSNSSKRYASNNRLVTALALGLPTIATAIPSYQEFSDYFAGEGTQQADEIMANPNVAHDEIVAFQDTEVSRFQLPSIMGAWQQLLLA